MLHVPEGARTVRKKDSLLTWIHLSHSELFIADSSAVEPPLFNSCIAGACKLTSTPCSQSMIEKWEISLRRINWAAIKQATFWCCFHIISRCKTFPYRSETCGSASGRFRISKMLVVLLIDSQAVSLEDKHKKKIGTVGAFHRVDCPRKEKVV